MTLNKFLMVIWLVFTALFLTGIMTNVIQGMNQKDHSFFGYRVAKPEAPFGPHRPDRPLPRYN